MNVDLLMTIIGAKEYELAMARVLIAELQTKLNELQSPLPLKEVPNDVC